MRRLMLTLALFAAPLAFAAPVLADDAGQAPSQAQRDARRQEWQAMTPEQREAKMKEWQAKREASMTPEQKAAHEARREAWEKMTPEQREAKRQEMRAHRGDRPHHHGRGQQGQ